MTDYTQDFVNAIDKSWNLSQWADDVVQAQVAYTEAKAAYRNAWWDEDADSKDLSDNVNFAMLRLLRLQDMPVKAARKVKENVDYRTI